MLAELCFYCPIDDLVGGKMTRAFSDDLRSRVLAVSWDGTSERSAAARFGVGGSTAIAWIACTRAGRLTPVKQGRRGGSRLDAHEGFIVGMIEEAKDIALNEMVLRLREERAVSIGRGALDVWLRRRAWTFKKDRTFIGAGAPRPFEASPRLVRQPTRSRSGAPRLH